MTANEKRPHGAPSGDLFDGGSELNSTEDAYGQEPWRAAYERYLRAWSAGRSSLQNALDVANAHADYWYLRANHSPAEIREMRLQAMDDAWREYWDAGMPAEEVAA